MGELIFSGTPKETHHCTSHQDGDWMIWRCPECRGYERRLNWRTGEMQVQRGGSQAQHTGASTKTQNMENLTRGLSPN